MFEMGTAWVPTPGNLTLLRTGWGPEVLQEIRKAAAKLPPVGGKAPVTFAPFTGNMVPVQMLHQIAIATPPPKTLIAECESESDPHAPMSSTRVKGKSKRAAATAQMKKKKGADAPCAYTSSSGTGPGWGVRGGGGRVPSSLGI